MASEVGTQTRVGRQRRRLSPELAANLVRLRDERGLTQQLLAKRARVSRGTVAQIETGEADPRLSTIELLAAALEVPPQSLLGERCSSASC